MQSLIPIFKDNQKSSRLIVNNNRKRGDQMAEAMDIVSIARQTDRITTTELIEAIFDDFIELHGDRSYKDDAAIVGGIGMLNGQPVTIIGNQKGHDLEENLKRNFGSPHPEGYRKSLRLMKQAEKFNRPIITFVNTSGAYCGVEAEERGQGEALAKNLLEMSDLSVPILSIIVGEGGSGGALALAAGNKVWMMEFSIYSILSPEGFASILWKDSKRAGEAAEIMKLTSYDLLELGVIDRIIYEEKEGEKISYAQLLNSLKEDIEIEIKQLTSKSKDQLIEQRYNRFRKF
ncbi:acetyl-CoA carboxylase carboxyltransferase subunit alpha [Marinilactibacillus psychrotolerans]|uniref:Acetyl-coenzyme A carboxylase carboxyl transferase subunit alpha n=2 Tax=Marinilactibacillus psychrotolerans TaxID=191770 RepID=A0A5R9C5K1_9LACT|nr:acetyl-CoA carboxylase carboxyltransferase subunit alpha [Marinilactibacillus psychrotolerans]TLQ08284.1 acetyl-CoA carboxylase carboxyltransferase subunit alpha [Marinilactibacillus psychrotolerans]